eukprot:gene22590-biopygen17748
MPAPCPHHARATHSAPCPRHARASVLFPLGSQDTGAGVARAWGGRGASLACDHHDGRSRAAAAPAPKCPGRPLAWPPPLHPLPALLLALDGGGAAGRGRPHARCRVTVACAAGGRCAAASQFGDLDGPVRASMDSVDLAGLTRLWTGVDTSVDRVVLRWTGDLGTLRRAGAGALPACKRWTRGMDGAVLEG